MVLKIFGLVEIISVWKGEFIIVDLFLYNFIKLLNGIDFCLIFDFFCCILYISNVFVVERLFIFIIIWNFCEKEKWFGEILLKICLWIVSKILIFVFLVRSECM